MRFFILAKSMAAYYEKILREASVNYRKLKSEQETPILLAKSSFFGVHPCRVIYGRFQNYFYTIKEHTTPYIRLIRGTWKLRDIIMSIYY